MFQDNDFHQNQLDMRFSGCGIMIQGVALINATLSITIVQPEKLILYEC